MNQAKENKFNLIDIIVFVFYFLFVVFSFLALSGFFSRFSVFIALIILFLILFYFRHVISFNKKYLWFFILTPAIGFGFLLLRGFFVGDAYWLYLPVAKDIVVSGRISDFLVGYYTSQMPLLSLLFAATFAVFNSFNEFLCLWTPFFFTAATLVILIMWAKERGLGKKYLFFIPFLFLTSSSVAYWGGWNLLQEAPLLFFTTTFFYYYEKYSNSRQKRDLIFFILSFILAVASKLIALFLALLIVWLFIKDKNRKNLLIYGFVFSVPVIFWFVRNYLIYDNPVFPLLNNVFKGQYYDALNNSYFPGYIYAGKSFILIIGSVIKYLWLGFPFILLSFYGFIKQRRYEYLVFIILFFFIKETLYFTTTVSVLRYYYLFFGLFLIYAFFGLEKLKSQLGLAFLTLLSVYGLMLVPITNSSSDFISRIEMKFSYINWIINYIHNYWYLFIIILAPIAYRLSKKSEIKIFLILFYSLYLFHLSFINNKSWLNVWPFILWAIFLMIIFAIKEFKYFKGVVVAAIIAMTLVNSYVLALIYYWRQGKIELPVSYVWESSIWAADILNEKTDSAERKDYYVLVATQPGYYYWWTDYQPINLFDFDFWRILDKYDIKLSDKELADYFKEQKVKYIIKNGEKNRFSDPNNSEFKDLFDKINNSWYFALVASNNQYYIWQVY